MPLDVRGCTRATLSGSACVYPSPRGVGNPLNPTRDRDWGLQLFPMNEEFPVSAGHKLALIKSLPFVHTARRYYRLDGLVRSSDRPRRGRSRPWRSAEKTIKLDYLEERRRERQPRHTEGLPHRRPEARAVPSPPRGARGLLPPHCRGPGPDRGASVLPARQGLASVASHGAGPPQKENRAEPQTRKARRCGGFLGPRRPGFRPPPRASGYPAAPLLPSGEKAEGFNVSHPGSDRPTRPPSARRARAGSAGAERPGGPSSSKPSLPSGKTMWPERRKETKR
ncbi:hypothetical protein D9C73_028019 [Collichthys lucidus]|uniref:Uncharacterized protein n=1 Tax=Collichthys lucidus TaxID=240159 RepID=A0A4U5TVB2_COLLU|nr:hypothetical protein D9C73_028470 [Collichthys lucidus]TKS65537.1 hypothetical protein D9C73_028019 [Collichthys lucidus]